MSAYTEAMLEAGWSYDVGSNGWRKTICGTAHWVSWEQAQKAFIAADAGTKYEPGEPVSETIAQVLTGLDDG